MKAHSEIKRIIKDKIQNIPIAGNWDKTRACYLNDKGIESLAEAIEHHTGKCLEEQYKYLNNKRKKIVDEVKRQKDNQESKHGGEMENLTSHYSTAIEEKNKKHNKLLKIALYHQEQFNKQDLEEQEKKHKDDLAKAYLNGARQAEDELKFSEEEVKDTLLKADLEYHKQPCVDDGFSEWLSFLAKAIMALKKGI